MKKFNFVRPNKVKLERYPQVNSVYRPSNNDDDTGVYEDFFSFEGGVDICDEQIQEWVNQNTQHLLDNPEENFSYTQSGNTLVMVTRSKEEINIWVSKSHMKAYIPLYEETTYPDEEETV